MDKRCPNIPALPSMSFLAHVLFQLAPAVTRQTIPTSLGKDSTSSSLHCGLRHLRSPACSCIDPGCSQRRSSRWQRKPAAPSLLTQQDSPANREYTRARGKIKYNLPQQSMKVNPNRHTSKGFLFAAFITCAEGTTASKQFALLNETKAREAFLGKIILKKHQQPIQTLQTLTLNKEM